MGMTLRGKTNDVDFNWTGWRYTIQLLQRLGQDVSEADGLNDGYVIKAATTRAWGKAIQEALDFDIVFEIKTPNKAYAGGFKTEPVVSRECPDNAFELSKETKKWLGKVANELQTVGRVVQV